MASLVYATPGSGPSAGGIGWINFGAGFTLAPGASFTGLTASLFDGSTITFDISNTTVSGDGVTFQALTPNAPFGTDAYTGMSSANICLRNPTGVPGTTSNTILLSNISITAPNGSPVSNYTMVLADGEYTNTGEQLVFNTNAGNWALLDTISPGPYGPSVTGVGTQTVTMSGTVSAPGQLPSSNVITSLSPTQVSCSVNSTTGGIQAFVVGVAINKVIINKVITSRYSGTDQFTLAISGTPSNTATTTGSSNGLQAQYAFVYGLVGNTYSITETMAAGSFGTLSNYTTTVVWSNLAADGTVGPSPGALGNSVSLALGDVLTATITNTVNPNPPSRGVSFI